MRMKIRCVTLLLASILLAGLTTQVTAGNPVEGETVFKKCKSCHSLKAGKKRVGPSLHGLFGRTAGTFVDSRDRPFRHSDDLAAAGQAGLVWQDDTFRSYIAAPRTYIGTWVGKEKAKIKMVFPGLRDATDIDNLAAFLTPYFSGEKEGR